MIDGFKKLLGIKTRDEYLKMPRRMPKDVPTEASDNWFYTREFTSEKTPEMRVFLGAVRDNYASKPKWTVYEYYYKLNDKKGEMTRNIRAIHDNPRDVVIEMMNFEAHQKIDHLLVPDSFQTFRKFGARQGINFDLDGNIFEVEKEKPIVRDAILNRDALDKIFNGEAQKSDISTWQGLYKNLVNKMPVERFDAQSLSSDAAFAEFSQESSAMMQKLRKLPEYLLDDKVSDTDKQLTLSNIVSYVIVNPLKFSTPEQMKTAQHLADATILVGLLRAGTHVYGEVFKGDGISTETMQLVTKIGETAAAFAKQRFNFDEAAAKKVADIIAQGDDPAGAELPLAKTLEAVTKPAASTNPQAPKS